MTALPLFLSGVLILSGILTCPAFAVQTVGNSEKQLEEGGSNLRAGAAPINFDWLLCMADNKNNLRKCAKYLVEDVKRPSPQQKAKLREIARNASSVSRLRDKLIDAHRQTSSPEEQRKISDALFELNKLSDAISPPGSNSTVTRSASVGTH